MSEHVSSETGKALAEAGWKWEPGEGDWCWDDWHKRCVLLDWSAREFPAYFLHLPRLGDLLGWLAARGGVVDTSIRTARLAAFCGDDKRASVHAHQGAQTYAGFEDTLLEAAALAVLAALKAEQVGDTD